MLSVTPRCCAEACMTSAAACCTPRGSNSSSPMMTMRKRCFAMSSPSCTGTACALSKALLQQHPSAEALTHMHNCAVHWSSVTEQGHGKVPPVEQGQAHLHKEAQLLLCQGHERGHLSLAALKVFHSKGESANVGDAQFCTPLQGVHHLHFCTFVIAAVMRRPQHRSHLQTAFPEPGAA